MVDLIVCTIQFIINTNEKTWWVDGLHPLEITGSEASVLVGLEWNISTIGDYQTQGTSNNSIFAYLDDILLLFIRQEKKK